MTILLLQDTVTKTGAFAGAGVAVDSSVIPVVSAIPPANWTIKVQVASFTAAQTARIVIEDSVDNFSSDILAGPTVSFAGGYSASSDLVLSFTAYDFPDLRVGTASAKLRVNLTSLSGGSITYKAWIEF